VLRRASTSGCTGHPTCKGKYQPWRAGVRQYGCFRHHELRRAKIERWGPRPGWESFEQWPPPPAPATAPEEAAAAATCRAVSVAAVGAGKARASTVASNPRRRKRQRRSG
jgi:hypothetical protein